MRRAASVGGGKRAVSMKLACTRSADGDEVARAVMLAAPTEGAMTMLLNRQCTWIDWECAVATTGRRLKMRVSMP